MSDTISRQAVKLIESDPDAYPQEWNDDYEKGFTDALNKVLALPPAQPEQRWIPCSERLPDQNGKYLVVGRQKAINILKFDGGRWYGKWGVVAWMPLPEPYREERIDE